MGLTSLRTLSLSRNELSGGLAVGVFSPLTALMQLSLRYTGLTDSEKDRIREELKDRRVSITF